MSGFNQRGPEGAGPMTGWQRGMCRRTEDQPNAGGSGDRRGQGGGMGRRSGSGQGAGQGLRLGRRFACGSVPPQKQD
jgi:hypothetical protein